MIESIRKDEYSIKQEQKAKAKIKERASRLKAIQILENDFNMISKHLNLPFYIHYVQYTKDGNVYPHLYMIKTYKFLFMKFREKLELKQMFWHEKENIWSFCNGLPIEIFKSIEPVLNKCASKFKIEINDGEVPNKYKILKELDNWQK